MENKAILDALKRKAAVLERITDVRVAQFSRNNEQDLTYTAGYRKGRLDAYQAVISMIEQGG